MPVSNPAVPLLNREMAILEFNRRVLAQARRADVPPLERQRYNCIVSSNMDEFFEVRLADYIEDARLPGAGALDGDLETVARAAHALIDDQYKAFHDEVMPELQRGGIVVTHALNSRDGSFQQLFRGLSTIGLVYKHVEIFHQ